LAHRYDAVYTIRPQSATCAWPTMSRHGAAGIPE